jgi:uncharacterized membrane protein
MLGKGRIRLVYAISLAGIIFWLGSIFLAPFLKAKSLFLGDFIYALFSSTCHQIPDRCFTLFGHPLAVCTRCLGIYAGFFLGTLFFPFSRNSTVRSLPKIKTFILVTGPIVLDTLGNFLSFWSTPSWARFFLGFLWGIILPFYFIIGISDAFSKKEIHKNIS